MRHSCRMFRRKSTKKTKQKAGEGIFFMPHEALQDGKRTASCIRTWAEMQTAAEQFKCSSRKECEMLRRSGFRNGRPPPFPARSAPGAARQSTVPPRSALTRSAPGRGRWTLRRRRRGSRRCGQQEEGKKQEDVRTQEEESGAASGLPGGPDGAGAWLLSFLP